MTRPFALTFGPALACLLMLAACQTTAEAPSAASSEPVTAGLLTTGDGHWNMKAQSSYGPYSATIKFKEAGGALQATYSDGYVFDNPVTVDINGSRLTLTRKDARYDRTLTYSFRLQQGQQFAGRVTGPRSQGSGTFEDSASMKQGL